MADLDNFKEFATSRNGLLFIGIFILTVVVALATSVFLMPQEDPEPPEEQPFIHGMSYDYTDLEFTYAYSGPKNPEESDKILPERVIIHTGDEITKETRLHEFNPTYRSEQDQSYSVDLTELAEDPDDPLRTHPEINMTVVYTNGARETVATTLEPENVEDIIYANYRVERVDNNSSLLITFDKIAAEKVTVETANETYTATESTEIKVTPDDYYSDQNGDGIYETRETVKIKKHYKDVEATIREARPRVPEPTINTGESNREDHFVFNVSTLAVYDSVTVDAGGKYIEEHHYNPESEKYEGSKDVYVQQAEGVGKTWSTILTIKDDAEELKLYAEYNGRTYVVKTFQVPDSI